MRDTTPDAYWHSIQVDPYYYARRLRLFDLHVDDLTGLWVCDYGCGPLRGVAGIAQKAHRRYAVDPAVEQYQEWPGAPTLPLLADASTIPTDSCDLVICWDVLDHAEERKQIIEDITRITRTGGECAFLLHVASMWDEVHLGVTPDRLWSLLGGPKRKTALCQGCWTVRYQKRDLDPEWNAQRLLVLVTRTDKGALCGTTASRTARPKARFPGGRRRTPSSSTPSTSPGIVSGISISCI